MCRVGQRGRVRVAAVIMHVSRTARSLCVCVFVSRCERGVASSARRQTNMDGILIAVVHISTHPKGFYWGWFDMATSTSQPSPDACAAEPTTCTASCLG